MSVPSLFCQILQAFEQLAGLTSKPNDASGRALA
ncbi:hypothetical protein V462_15140 [Pantoea ananatis 15320]|nr:hypothetical protein L585_08115 [Pantoea ananatis BRT175]PKC33679.1 hypothetical protein V462_15140 [Pantoea ananatis 15320]PKC46152.1 hypothetical protein V461_05595 [Pantoea ananatis BRT98]